MTTTKITLSSGENKIEMVIEHESFFDEIGNVMAVYEDFMKVMNTGRVEVATPQSTVVERQPIQKSTKASEKQISYLRSMGYEGKADISSKEANDLIRIMKTAK